MGAVVSTPDTKIGGGGGGKGVCCTLQAQYERREGGLLSGQRSIYDLWKGSMILSYPDPRYVSIVAISTYYNSLCLRKRGSGYETNSMM